MIEPDNTIRFFDRHEIDISKWDDCIQNAPNGLIYGRSFYLDSMAENWSGLVSGDYKKVMPLTWKKKFGIKYLYQPYFTKTLGVFGSGAHTFDISSFLNAVPRKFKYWDIDLNENNFISSKHKKLSQYARTNYLLSLENDYENISQQYKRLAKRMKKKAIQNNIEISSRADPSVIISLYKRDYAISHRSIGNSIYEKLRRCTDIAFKNDLADGYLARSTSGEILAYYITLQDEHFVYSLLGGSTETGRKTGAFYMLTDRIIQMHAGGKRIFRFEGSDIPGISFFDKLFGPKKITYQHLVMNNLPFPIRFFK